jgi:hypothetical protein
MSPKLTAERRLLTLDLVASNGYNSWRKCVIGRCLYLTGRKDGDTSDVREIQRAG